MINSRFILFSAGRIFIFISLFLHVQPAHAQNQIKGKVINEETKEPVSQVSVYLNSTSLGSSTDKDGNFSIRNVQPGKY